MLLMWKSGRKKTHEKLWCQRQSACLLCVMFLDDVEGGRGTKGVGYGADKTKKTLSKTLSRSKVEKQRLATLADDAHQKSYKKLREQKEK